MREEALVALFMPVLSCQYRSFVHSLQAGVQPTLDSSAETVISIHCANLGRGGKFVGVCGVCA